MHLLGFAHHVHQLLVNDLHHLEGLETGNRVYQHVTVEVHAVLGRKYAVDILTSCVNQLHLVISRVDARDFGEGFKLKIYIKLK